MHNNLDRLNIVVQNLTVANHRLWLNPSDNDIIEAETAIVIALNEVKKVMNDLCDQGYRFGYNPLEDKTGKPLTRYGKWKDIDPLEEPKRYGDE